MHPPISTQEQDLLNRSSNRYKRRAIDEPPSPTAGVSAWSQRSGAELLRPTNEPPDLYTGLDEPESDIQEFIEHYKSVAAEKSPISMAGVKEVSIPIDTLKQLWRPWRRALIIKVLGRNVSFKALQARLSDMWAHGQHLEITDLDEGFYVIRFVSKSAYDHVLENGPWQIQNHYITIAKWKPSFHPSSDWIKSTLIWVRIPRVPIEYFDNDTLLLLGNCIGSANKVDATSLRSQRGKYARVCVEIDLSKPLPVAVSLNGKVYKIEYEGLHMVCFECGVYGHKTEDCPQKPKDMDDVQVQQPEKPTAPTNTNLYGPWIFPTNRRRKPPSQQPSQSTPQSNQNTPQASQNFQPTTAPPSSSTPPMPQSVGFTSPQPHHNINPTQNRFSLLTIEESQQPNDNPMTTLQQKFETIPQFKATTQVRQYTRGETSNTRGRGRGKYAQSSKRTNNQPTPPINPQTFVHKPDSFPPLQQQTPKHTQPPLQDITSVVDVPSEKAGNVHAQDEDAMKDAMNIDTTLTKEKSVEYDPLNVKEKPPDINQSTNISSAPSQSGSPPNVLASGLSVEHHMVAQ